MVTNFFAPADVEEALDLKKSEKNSLYLAGGTLINRGMRKSGMNLISLHRISSLKNITRKSDCLCIGSMVTLSELYSAPLLRENRLDELQDACRVISRNIRNMSTIGGCIAYNYSNSDIIPSLIATNTQVSLIEDHNKGLVMPLEDYLAKRADAYSALIADVKIPVPDRFTFIAGRRFARTSLDFPTVKAAVGVRLSGQITKSARIAIGGIAERVVRLQDLEEFLLGKDLTKYGQDLKGEIAQIIDSTTAPKDDPRGTASFKKTVTLTLIEDVLAEILRKAGEN